MATTYTKFIIGFLVILVSTSIIYITLSNQGIRLRVDNDKTVLYVLNNNSQWIIAGKEYNRIFNNTKLINRVTSGIKLEQSQLGSIYVIKRTTPYQKGMIIIDTYTFNGNFSEKEMFPISHTVEVLNGKGMFYRYTVDELKDTGVKRKLTGEHTLFFGNNVKVYFNSSYQWAWIGYPYGSDSLSAQYKLTSDYEVFDVKLFDPVTLRLDGTSADRKYEFRSVVNVSATGTGQVCVGVDAPYYKKNYTCGTSFAQFNYNITTLRQSNYSNISLWIFQETASQYSYNWTGVVDCGLTNFSYYNDANYTTKTVPNGDPCEIHLYSNWTKPINFQNATLQLVTDKDFIGSFHNYSIPRDCALSSKIMVDIYIRQGGVGIIYCWNQTEWKWFAPSYTIGSSHIYEEGMWWNRSDNINIKSNPNNDIVLVQLNITSPDISSNLNISYYGQWKNYSGNIIGKYLKQQSFIYGGLSKTTSNLTYITAGSKYIYVQVPDKINNLSFDLTGYNLDAQNAFSYIEHFNGTAGVSGFNNSKSYQIDAPLGVYDKFAYNVSGRWSESDAGSTIAGTTSKNFSYGGAIPNKHLNLYIYVNDDCTPTTYTRYLDYTNDNSIPIVNTSRIELLFYQNAYESESGTVPSSARTSIYLTDSSSNIELIGWNSVHPYGSTAGVRNLTLLNRASDYKLWQGYLNGSSIGTFDLSGLNFNNQIKIRGNVYAFAGGPCTGSMATASAQLKYYSLKWGGAWLNKSTNGTFELQGNVTSKKLFIAPTDISTATLTSTDYTPSGTSILYYLSNDCDTATPHYQQVLSGELHSFTTTGNGLCWKARLTGINVTSPVIRKINVDIIGLASRNISVDLGDDGQIDWTYTGILNSTTSPKTVQLPIPTEGYKTIKISSGTAGLIQVNNFNLNATLNPIELNSTYFEDCSQCKISLYYSGSNLTVSGLEFDYFGSKNYTAYAYDSGGSTTKKVQIYYSKFNLSLPEITQWYDVFPSSRNAKNVSPYGQTTDIPIWNVTNLAYDKKIDIYVKTNETVPSCLNITYSNQSIPYNISVNQFRLNTSYQKILSNISISNAKGIWNYFSLSGCTAAFYIPYVTFASVCNTCVYDKNDLDNYNLITE